MKKILTSIANSKIRSTATLHVHTVRPVPVDTRHVAGGHCRAFPSVIIAAGSRPSVRYCHRGNFVTPGDVAVLVHMAVTLAGNCLARGSLSWNQSDRKLALRWQAQIFGGIENLSEGLYDHCPRLYAQLCQA